MTTTLTNDITPHRDTRLEQLLGQHQLGIVLEWVPVDHIDLDAPTQIRDTEYDPDTVARYTEALSDGAIFPAVLLRRQGPHLTALGGRHRIEAHHAAGTSHIAAYLTECDNPTAYQLSVIDNTTHGLPLTNEERARHAITLIERHGLTQADAAKQVGLSQGTISRQISIRKGTERASMMAVDRQYQLLDQVSQGRCASIKSDAVFGLVVNTAAALGLTQLDINELVTSINRAGTETDQILTLGDFQAEIEARHMAKNRISNEIGTLRSTVTRINGLDTGKAITQCKPRDRSDTAAMTRRAAMTLLEIAGRLDK